MLATVLSPVSVVLQTLYRVTTDLGSDEDKHMKN